MHHIKGWRRGFPYSYLPSALARRDVNFHRVPRKEFDYSRYLIRATALLKEVGWIDVSPINGVSVMKTRAASRAMANPCAAMPIVWCEMGSIMVLSPTVVTIRTRARYQN